MTLTLDEILQDVRALEKALSAYESKYGVLSETFYELYLSGEEPADDGWVSDWNDWAGAYEIWLRRRRQYNDSIATLKKQMTLSDIVFRTARHESIPLPA